MTRSTSAVAVSPSRRLAQLALRRSSSSKPGIGDGNGGLTRERLEQPRSILRGDYDRPVVLRALTQLCPGRVGRIRGPPPVLAALSAPSIFVGDGLYVWNMDRLPAKHHPLAWSPG